LSRLWAISVQSGPTLTHRAMHVQAALGRAPSGWPRGPRRAGIAAGEGAWKTEWPWGLASVAMDGGSRKDGAIRKNCDQENYGFRNTRGERMLYFQTEGEAVTTERAPMYATAR
jgi:hypothetical protein